ncbi:SDR family NAD(P)-dependent oxidoreductase [Cohnella sp. AR92]|uniref:SDR family NAD(P)-dependent oxidoreductase n=1 Tax=Cohnella sp. AR92 TaxID=648716 RepID=UPI000F8DB323|nr:SDR family oxidoreductase [Cohnella sp. AR92]RUS45143.1 SDR family oxidoreductase [Cohnella sp. AR92]
MRRLENKVAIVTGAASGMGEATVKLFAAEGAKVVAADINVPALEKVVAEVKAAGGEIIAKQVDIGNEEMIKDMINAAVETYGRLDILHNNAARLDFQNDLNVKDLDVLEWDETIRYNLKSVMLGTKYALPVMLANGGGSIINTASMGGQVGEMTKSAYAAAKAGVISLTRSTAVQFGKQGIRCNAIAPGMVLSRDKIDNAPQFLTDLIEVYKDTKLVDYIGDPMDIANLALFLGSDESRFITGQVINADGGILAQNPTVPGLKKANINW